MHTTLRDRLKLARKGCGLSQQALAEATALSRAAISLLERDAEYDPRLSTVQGISRVLGDPHLLCKHCAETAS